MRVLSVSDATTPFSGDARIVGVGVASVWNGSQGIVVVVVRGSAPPSVQRFEFADTIDSPLVLEHATTLAFEFAKSLGFELEAIQFEDLDPGSQSACVASWNTLRRIDEPEPSTLELVNEVPPARTAAAAGAERFHAVLGKISLVRRSPPSALARLLGYF